MTDPVDRAYHEGKIGKRQHAALKKHAQKHREEHVENMLVLMRHITVARAHKEAMKEA